MRHPHLLLPALLCVACTSSTIPAPTETGSPSDSGSPDSGDTDTDTDTDWTNTAEVVVSEGLGWTAVSAANQSTCALLGTALRCWGRASDPAVSMAPSVDLLSVSLGVIGCGVGLDQQLVCWGDHALLDHVPTGEFIDVSSLGERPCAVRTSGQAVCWDEDGPSEAPEGTFVSVLDGGTLSVIPNACFFAADGSSACTPSPFPALHAAEVVDMAFYRYWSFAIVDGGADVMETTTIDWLNPGVGDGDSANPPGVRPYRAIASSLGKHVSNRFCLIDADAAVHCDGEPWDYDNRHNGGLDSPPAGTFESLSVGRYHGCAIRTDSALACWGTDPDAMAIPGEGA